MKQYCLLAYLLFFGSVNCIAQSTCSCELAPKLIPSIITYFNSGNLDSAEYFIKQFNQSTSQICKANYVDGMAQIALSRKQFAVAKKFLTEEEAIVQQLNCDKKPTIRYYNTLSKYYTETGKIDSTLIVALKIIELSAAQKEAYGLARALLNAGAIFSELKDFTKARHYFYEASKIAVQQKDTTILCAAYARLSSNFADVYTIDKKIEYLDSLQIVAKKVLAIARFPQDLIESLQAYSNLSKYFLIQKQYEASIQNADSIILKSPKGIHDFDRYFMLAYERKAEAFLELKNFQKAYVMADSAVYFAKIFNKQLTIYPLELLYKSAKALNKFNAALWAFEQMTATRDSIFSVEKNKAIQELESKYNQSKNEQIINELSQQRQIYLLLIVIAIAIIIISIFYLRQQKLQHKQTIMETEQRLNRARMNPHFFFNTLASLQSFALTENDNKNLAANISKFSHIMRETLESTYKEYVTIEQEIDFLNEYLQLQTIRFPKRFQYRIQADDKLEIDALQIPSMILQPFVENAIEHGLKGLKEEGLITIHFSENKEGLLIEINDNGNGFSIQNKTNGEHISRASQIVKDRIYLLNIKLKTRAGFILNNNENGKGVCVKIQLPLLYK